MWFVYAVYNSVVKKIYVGESGDTDHRVIEHNEKRGNHYTAHFEGEWKLIYTEKLENRKSAKIREKQLKSYRGREFLKQFIKK